MLAAFSFASALPSWHWSRRACRDKTAAMRILLVEDEPHLGAAVQEHVRQAGHAVDWFQRLDLADAAVRAVPYDALLLDLHLPDGKGLDFLRALRRRREALPVVILTARDMVSDRIEGLQAGADDYLVKPFDLDELIARLQAVSRRYFGNAVPVVQLGRVELEPEVRRARLNGESVALTAREWAVIDVLMRRPSATVSKEQIAEALYAFDEEIESNAIEVFISRIRRKLGRDFVRTNRGLGYRLGN
jgi:two-component system OmpR family response regulator